MFRHFLFITFFLFPFPLFASPLTDLQETYKNITDWQANFTQSTYVDVLEKHVEKKGTIIIKKPGKLKIQYTQIPQKIYVSNGKKMVVYVAGDSQAQVYSKVSKLVSKEALAFLQGLADVSKEFKVEEIEASKISEWMMGSDKLVYLMLTPLRKHSSILEIVLGLDPKSHLVEEVTIANASGNKTHYVFSTLTLNSNVPDSTFEFTPPPGVTLIKN